MKKIFSNKFVIALSIIAVAGGVTYFTTWGNKSWLIRQISDKGGDAPKTPGGPTPALQTMSTAQLRKLLKDVS